MLDWQAAQLEQMRGAPPRELEAIGGRILSIGSLIVHQTSIQQKEARTAMFERTKVDHRVEIMRLIPLPWAETLM